jgi:hypothetical protein
MRRDDLDPARGILTAIGYSVIIWIILLLLLTGCESLTPYTAAEHKSNPHINDDGFNWICAGGKARGQLSAKLGYCWEIGAGNNWNVIEARIEYDWREQ